MRHILRRRELVADDWRYLGEPAGEGEPLIVPLAQLKGDLLQWQRRTGPLGARLSPADQAEELVPLLPRLALVALEFPNPGDGRGYSQARLLRGRLGFRGELRAFGAGVRQDQAFLLTRCGFDSLEPAPGVDLAAVRSALGRYNVAYQPGAAQPELRRQRF
jgi:uncharacterized protein (DUF934 family)